MILVVIPAVAVVTFCLIIALYPVLQKAAHERNKVDWNDLAKANGVLFQGVIDFLEGTNMVDLYQHLSLESIFWLPQDFVKVKSGYVTDIRTHPFGDSPGFGGETHELVLIFDVKFRSQTESNALRIKRSDNGGPFRYNGLDEVYARCQHTSGLVINYLTNQEYDIGKELAFDPRMQGRSLVFQGFRYVPHPYEGSRPRSLTMSETACCQSAFSLGGRYTPTPQKPR